MSLSEHFSCPFDNCDTDRCHLHGCEEHPMFSKKQSEKANYLRSDHSHHFLSIDPLFHDEMNLSKVMSLEVSLDLAKLFASTLEANGLADHAKLMRDWIERIAERKEPKMESAITYTNSEEYDTTCLKDPAKTYYRIISKLIDSPIGKCTGVGISDVLEENPDSTFEEITKEEYEAEE